MRVVRPLRKQGKPSIREVIAQSPQCGQRHQSVAQLPIAKNQDLLHLNQAGSSDRQNGTWKSGRVEFRISATACPSDTLNHAGAAQFTLALLPAKGKAMREPFFGCPFPTDVTAEK
jgi:hypothetical protein